MRYSKHMKIAVLGANGRTGKLFVEMAASYGHQVLAGVRNPAQLPSNTANVTYIACDVQNLAQLRQLVEQSDCVVSLLGHSRKSTAHIQRDAMRAIVQMNKSQNRRIFSLTGTGVHTPNDKTLLADYAITKVLQILDKKRMQDGVDHYEVLKNSNAPWTVVRVSTLGNGVVQKYRFTEHGPPRYITNRTTVCAAILECITNNTFVRCAPIISK